MKLPNQSAPVIRSGKASFETKNVDPSCGVACIACKAAGLPSIICDNL